MGILKEFGIQRIPGFNGSYNPEGILELNQLYKPSVRHVEITKDLVEEARDDIALLMPGLVSVSPGESFRAPDDSVWLASLTLKRAGHGYVVLLPREEDREEQEVEFHAEAGADTTFPVLKTLSIIVFESFEHVMETRAKKNVS